MEALRIREGTDADTEFFRELEMQTTWENLPPDDCERLTQDQVWLALEETHQLLLADPAHRQLVRMGEVQHHAFDIHGHNSLTFSYEMLWKAKYNASQL